MLYAKKTVTTGRQQLLEDMHEASGVAMWWKSGNDLGLASRCCCCFYRDDHYHYHHLLLVYTTQTLLLLWTFLLPRISRIQWMVRWMNSLNVVVVVGNSGLWSHSLLGTKAFSAFPLDTFSLLIPDPTGRWWPIEVSTGEKVAKKWIRRHMQGLSVETIWWLMGHENAWSITSLQMACKHAFVCFCQLEL